MGPSAVTAAMLTLTPELPHYFAWLSFPTLMPGVVPWAQAVCQQASYLISHPYIFGANS